MKSRPCGSMLGSVRPSLRPGVCSSVNRSWIGLLPSAMALNWLAYLPLGLYATTMAVPAYWTYHLVNLGISGVMLSPPTDSKTSGLISPEAMSASRSPEEAARPENAYPVALVNAGPATFVLRYWSEEA